MSMRIETATGAGLVDLTDPDCHPATTRITSRAIAHGLARINRFAGATELPVTVAGHSLLVANIVARRHPQLQRGRLHGLLHDAHEYLLGDIKTPTEMLLEHVMPGTRRAIETLKTRLDLIIFHALGVQPPDADTAEAVAEADWLAADAEWRAHMAEANGPSPWLARTSGGAYSPLPHSGMPLAWPDAEERFRLALETQLATWAKHANGRIGNG